MQGRRSVTVETRDRAKHRIFTGDPLKAIAGDLGVSNSYVAKLAYVHGLRRRFITDAEWQKIQAARLTRNSTARV